eukprot:2713779-Pleurochrysis_carterae.AAC.2
MGNIEFATTCRSLRSGESSVLDVKTSSLERLAVQPNVLAPFTCYVAVPKVRDASCSSHTPLPKTTTSPLRRDQAHRFGCQQAHGSRISIDLQKSEG